jgi:hypothetical protein
METTLSNLYTRISLMHGEVNSNSLALVRERTIPPERSPLVDEVSAFEVCIGTVTQHFLYIIFYWKMLFIATCFSSVFEPSSGNIHMYMYMYNVHIRIHLRILLYLQRMV